VQQKRHHTHDTTHGQGVQASRGCYSGTSMMRGVMYSECLEPSEYWGARLMVIVTFSGE
jgi:hypothetical protein